MQFLAKHTRWQIRLPFSFHHSRMKSSSPRVSLPIFGFHGTTIEACHSAGFDPSISAQALDFTEIASRVAIGLGVALAPKSLSAVGLPGIRYINVTGTPTTSDVVLAFRKSEASQAVKSYIAICRRMGL